MLTLLKGMLKAAIVSTLAMFFLMMIGLCVLLGPLMIPFLIIILVLGGLGLLDWKCVIKPVLGGIVGIFRKIFNAIGGVLRS